MNSISAPSCTITDEYRATLAFLADPACYPAQPTAVQRIETHMSFVFVAGELVYKIKKPIRLEFVDFTSLEARRQNCEREVAVNQQLAPEVYLGVVPLVRRPDGKLAWDGEGVPVEWLVVMRRLDQDRLLHHMIDEGKATTADLDRLCDVLARFYMETRRIPISPDGLIDWWREGIAAVERSLTDHAFDLPTADVAPAVEALQAFLTEKSDLLAERAEKQRILDGHGDLRPEHVYLGPPTLLVDRLEFNERLRWIDPFDEVTFLGLECTRLGADWIAAHLPDGLAERLHEHPPPELLRFYRCYRACLRARLSIEHMRDPKPRTPERWPRQAREYLDLAARALPL